MATGITVHDECSERWSEMKLRHKHTYVTFKIEEDRQIVVDAIGDKGASYDSFKAVMPNNDCRYAVVEVPGTTKIVFIMWAPDAAPVKSKMIYASTRQAISDKLNGHHKTLQASDLADLNEAKISKLIG